ncbi:hypothetical protein [Mangrovihabitans endophyticus]|uniref:Uncharacterized protein n=1 Tax=Mangrovihabitans endophyticus TaxID=1751298 RepID=A0A8J3C3H4_9ACTN|nr:hypothetical protein [Mangrovihabitans endophyticus]GGL13231.1 hypothetical protein GCM10012284_54890 [Mangrovihabitans endophyticus]
MGDLKQLFDDVAAQPAPPSRLTSADIFAAGRRRHRRWQTVRVGGGAALGVLALAGATLLMRPQAPDPRQPPATPAGAASTAAAVATGAVRFSVAADPDHLYMGRSTCADVSCKTRVWLYGSVDGGHEWTPRGGPASLAAITAVGPETLIGVRDDTAGQTLLTSRDGGRDWTPVRDVTAPAGHVGAGRALVCAPADSAPADGAPADGGCVPRVVDPAAGTAAPLADEPSLTVAASGAGLAAVTTAPGHPDMLWLTGVTADSGAPAVARSTDAGASWDTYAFPKTGCHTGCRAPQVVAGADGVAYATVGDRVYRSTGSDTGSGTGSGARSWALVGSVGREPAWSFVLGDGRQVLAVNGPDGWTFVSRSGGTFRDARITGLPDRVAPVRRTADGWFYTVDDEAGRWYGSADGLTWAAL